MKLLSALVAIPGVASLLRNRFRLAPGTTRTVQGLQFTNPIGLAAGFDKDGKYLRAVRCLGFGFIEVGTVTPRPQSGNPRPRLFRLKRSGALINRMGFNNGGVEQLAARLERWRERDFVLGANIGKNKSTPNKQATDDYVACFERLHDLVDYFVVNVSSPNTPNLRDLQDKAPLTALLTELQRRNQDHAHPKPLFLKIAPDLTTEQLDDIVDIARETQLSGIVATNTTISRRELIEPALEVERLGAGGVSGVPLRERSTEVIRYLHQAYPELPIIGVGGINNAKDMQDKLRAGAVLIQVYTGFIYEGPGIVRRLLRGLD